MKNKSTPEQKKHWLEHVKRGSGSRFARFTRSEDYNPTTKAPSQRDTHRFKVKVAKKGLYL
jgi:hypothetical protein